VVPVMTSLLSEESKPAFVAQYREDYDALRRIHGSARQTLASLAEVREKRTPIAWRAEDIPQPEFTGVRVLSDVPLQTLREYIDWTPFFHTWELKGVFPAILNHPKYGTEAKKLHQDALAMLDEIIAGKRLTARGVYGLFAAQAVGDDIQLFSDESHSEPLERLHFLRQQAVRENKAAGEVFRSLADFVAPAGRGLRDHVGAFAVTAGIGLPALVAEYRADHDDYRVIMAEALADRLAEAFAEYVHKRVRAEWGYGRQETLSAADLITEKYRGIRPAPGYPACPDHTEKLALWTLLDAESNTGIQLTESYAMLPGASVSGLYFAHPEARYFAVGKIGRDQVVDYSKRKGLTLAETERWLGPNLGYDPATEN